MRLLNTISLKLEDFFGDIPQYAVLSHRWGEAEVTFQALTNNSVTHLLGWKKVTAACRIAVLRGLGYIWIDTCCIDKSSSAELNESINSMYKWYEAATECYAFLGDVYGSLETRRSLLKEEIASSVWFTRGWTLQELIAPPQVIFFNHDWEQIWTKSTHSQELYEITRIGRALLDKQASISDYSLAQRMAWAAERRTTRLEDEAYCLLGIFEVNMPMLYGEGSNAFRRLQEEIIKQYDDQTLFCWHDDQEVKSILAPSVSCFKGLHDLMCIYATNDSRSGFTLSNSGLSINLMLIPWDMNVYVAPLSCGSALSIEADDSELNVRGYRRMCIFLHRTKFHDHLVRVRVDNKDHILLNSDIVAYKRDSFKIANRQVFLRQSLIDLAYPVTHSFAIHYRHPSMFAAGSFPALGSELLTSDRDTSKYDGVFHIIEPYSHYELAVFNIQRLTADKRPCYLHLGFDINFRPVCFITRTSWLDDQRNRACMRDFEGMHSLRQCRVSSLAWLLEQVKQNEKSDFNVQLTTSDSIMAEIHCEELNLKIVFELGETVNSSFYSLPSAKTWRVTFAVLKVGVFSPSARASFTEGPIYSNPILLKVASGMKMIRERAVRTVHMVSKFVSRHKKPRVLVSLKLVNKYPDSAPKKVTIMPFRNNNVDRIPGITGGMDVRLVEPTACEDWGITPVPVREPYPGGLLLCG